MTNGKFTKPLDFINLIFLILLLAVFIVLAFSLVKSLDAYHNKDFFTFWLGGKLTAQGLDVYDQSTWVNAHNINGSTWIPNLYYVYPLTTAVLFVPLGILPIASAALIWLILSFIFIVASLLLLIRVWHMPAWKRFIIPLSLGLLLFRPAILIFLMGQIDGFLLFIMVLFIVFLSRKNVAVAHVLLGFLILKPNIGVPILGFYGLWLLFQSRWKAITYLSGSSLVLLLLPLVIDPHWITKYTQVGFYKAQDQNLFPSFRGLAGLITANDPTFSILLWLVFSLVLLGIVGFYVFKRQKQLQETQILMLAISVAVLVTPYMRSYDFLLLLIPILYTLVTYVHRGGSFLKANMIFLGWGLYSFGFLLVANVIGHDIWSVLFPTTVLLICLIDWKRDPHLEK